MRWWPWPCMCGGGGRGARRGGLGIGAAAEAHTLVPVKYPGMVGSETLRNASCSHRLRATDACSRQCRWCFSQRCTCAQGGVPTLSSVAASGGLSTQRTHWWLFCVTVTPALTPPPPGLLGLERVRKEAAVSVVVSSGHAPSFFGLSFSSSS